MPMPELPEVETICNNIKSCIIGNKFTDIVLFSSRLRKEIPANFVKKLINQSIIKIWRRAKYIIIALSSGDCLVIHLGMTGNLYFMDHYPGERKHVHVVFSLEQGGYLIYRDPRKFGLIDLMVASELDILFKSLGPEPLSADFHCNYLANILKAKKSPIKNIIMDARIVVGIGNIYASEILYRSRISPLRSGNMLTIEEIEYLIENTHIVLAEAIAAGGSTISDYRNAYQAPGYFQHKFLVYGKAGENCSLCKNPIVRTVQAGRSSFYCSICQT